MSHGGGELIKDVADMVLDTMMKLLLNDDRV
jgi:hypothetical protein